MTTPDEHRRNLGWTTSTLQDIADAAEPGSALHRRALQVLEGALSIEDIARLDSAPPERVEAAIAGIEAARELFLSALNGTNDRAVRRALEVTLRHYPQPMDFAFWRLMAREGAPMGGVILRTAGPLGG